MEVLLKIPELLPLRMLRLRRGKEPILPFPVVAKGRLFRALEEGEPGLVDPGDGVIVQGRE